MSSSEFQPKKIGFSLQQELPIISETSAPPGAEGQLASRKVEFIPNNPDMILLPWINGASLKQILNLVILGYKGRGGDEMRKSLPVHSNLVRKIKHKRVMTNELYKLMTNELRPDADSRIFFLLLSGANCAPRYGNRNSLGLSLVAKRTDLYQLMLIPNPSAVPIVHDMHWRELSNWLIVMKQFEFLISLASTQLQFKDIIQTFKGWSMERIIENVRKENLRNFALEYVSAEIQKQRGFISRSNNSYEYIGMPSIRAQIIKPVDNVAQIMSSVFEYISQRKGSEINRFIEEMLKLILKDENEETRSKYLLQFLACPELSLLKIEDFRLIIYKVAEWALESKNFAGIILLLNRRTLFESERYKYFVKRTIDLGTGNDQDCVVDLVEPKKLEAYLERSINLDKFSCAMKAFKKWGHEISGNLDKYLKMLANFSERNVSKLDKEDFICLLSILDLSEQMLHLAFGESRWNLFFVLLGSRETRRFAKLPEVKHRWLQCRIELIDYSIKNIFNSIRSIERIENILTFDRMVDPQGSLPLDVVRGYWEKLSEYPETLSDMIMRVSPVEREGAIFQILETDRLRHDEDLIRKVLGVEYYSSSGHCIHLTTTPRTQKNERGEIPFLTALRCGVFKQDILNALKVEHFGLHLDQEGNTPLMLITKALISRSINLFWVFEACESWNDNAYLVRDAQGLTPLHRAVIANRGDIVEYMLNEIKFKFPSDLQKILKLKGRIPDRNSKKKRTPLQMAEKLKHHELVQMLSAVTPK